MRFDYKAYRRRRDGTLVPLRLRRQENLLSTFHRTIRAERIYGVEIPKHHTRQGISADFAFDSLQDFEITFAPSNRLIARDCVLAFNPKKGFSETAKARLMRDYLESLEMFNVCRNCGQCIKAKETEFGFVGFVVPHWQVRFNPAKNGIEYHFTGEARKTSLGTIEYDTRPVRVLHSKCECIYAKMRERSPSPRKPIM